MALPYLHVEELNHIEVNEFASITVIQKDSSRRYDSESCFFTAGCFPK